MVPSRRSWKTSADLLPTSTRSPVQPDQAPRLGNDFLVALDEVNGPRPDGRRRARGRRLCDRRTGHRRRRAHPRCGARSPTPTGIDVVMHLFNADGSRAEMSGNGIRCLAQAVARGPRAWRGRRSAVAHRRRRPRRSSSRRRRRRRRRRAGERRRWARPDPVPTCPLRVAERARRPPSPRSTSATPTSSSRSTTPPRSTSPRRARWLEQQFAGGINVEFIAVHAGRPDAIDAAGVGARRGHHPGLRHRRLRGGARRPRVGPRRRHGSASDARRRRPQVELGDAHRAHRAVDPADRHDRGSPMADHVDPTSDESATAAASASSAASPAGSSSAPSGSASCSSASRCPPDDEDDTERSLDELALLVDTAGADVVDRVVQRRTAPDPATYIGKGKVEELRELCRGRRRRHRRVRRRADPGPAVQPREAARPHGHRPHRGDPRHLRPERPQPGGQGPGRAGPAALPAAPPAGQGQEPQPAGRRHRHPRGPGETQLEIDRRRLQRRIHKLEADLRAHRPGTATPSARPATGRGSRPSPSSATPTPASRRCSTGSPTPACWSRTGCSPPSTPPPAASQLPGGETVLLTDTVGFIRKLPHQLVRGVQVDARGGDRGRPARARRRRVGARPRRATSPRCDSVLREIGAGAVPELLVFNKADLDADARRQARGRPTRGRWPSRPRTGEGIDELLRTIGDRLRALTTVLELLVPFDRGDVLAVGAPRGRGARRDGRPRPACACGPGSTTRGRRRLASTFVVADDDPATDMTADRAGSRRRRTPTTASTSCAAVADEHARRVRRPVGRHTDRPAAPSRGRARSAASGAERGYPPSIGTAAFREAAARLAHRRFGVAVDPDHLAACVGTKELVAGAAALAAPAPPRPRHRALPGGQLPDLRHGRRARRRAGRCRCPSTTRGASTSTPIDPADAARALCLWVNTPGNPAGGLDDLGAAAAWGRAHGVPVFSDECYVEFTWDGPAAHDPRARHRRRGRRALAVEAVEPGRCAGRLLRRRPRASSPT